MCAVEGRTVLFERDDMEGWLLPEAIVGMGGIMGRDEEPWLVDGRGVEVFVFADPAAE